jgi:hypothetical protein
MRNDRRHGPGTVRAKRGVWPGVYRSPRCALHCTALHYFTSRLLLEASNVLTNDAVSRVGCEEDVLNRVVRPLGVRLIQRSAWNVERRR